VKFEVEGPNFASIMRDIEGDVAQAATSAMRETGYKTLLELRRQVTDGGLGQRLANTWRDRVYPEKRKSMTPTGYIWSNAPEIIDGFVRGATILPVGGASYLWIPTKNVPRARGRVSRAGRRIKGGAMTPVEVESAYGADFVIRKGKSGTLLAFIDVVKQGGKAKPVLMFVLRKTVRLPKLLDLDGPARRWAANFEARFNERMRGS
jgi:hypothetical protein